MKTPLLNKKIKLEKFPGKGGWTYCRLPGIKPDPHAHFGWIKVRGTIDDFEIRQYHLMPMGNGELFLPVRAEIRKKLKKGEGDIVHVLLYRDDEDVYIPEELQECLNDDPDAETAFKKLPAANQRDVVKYIYALKDEGNRAERIAGLMKSNFKLP
jgi:hypothetical protein